MNLVSTGVKGCGPQLKPTDKTSYENLSRKPPTRWLNVSLRTLNCRKFLKCSRADTQQYQQQKFTFISELTKVTNTGKSDMAEQETNEKFYCFLAPLSTMKMEPDKVNSEMRRLGIYIE